MKIKNLITILIIFAVVQLVKTFLNKLRREEPKSRSHISDNGETKQKWGDMKKTPSQNLILKWSKISDDLSECDDDKNMFL